MTLRIQTRRGPNIARFIAERIAGRPVYISNVYSRETNGEYWFTTRMGGMGDSESDTDRVDFEL